MVLKKKKLLIYRQDTQQLILYIFLNTQLTVQFCTGVPQVTSKFQIPILTHTQKRTASDYLKPWVYA